MGADLHIPTLEKPVRAEWKPKFDAAVALRNEAADDIARAAAQKLVDEAADHLWGDPHYFRDSYNATSVLWRLGLSWWRDMEYDEVDEDVNVSPTACRRFLDKIEAATWKPVTRAELESRHATIDDDENSVEAWNAYYERKRERLIAFFKRGIENGGISASC